jgi:hypothetical protein
VFALSAGLVVACNAEPGCAPENVRVTLFGAGGVERTVSIASNLIRDRSQALPCDGKVRIGHLVLRVSRLQVLPGDDPSPIDAMISIALGDGMKRYIAYQKEVGAIKDPELDESSGLSYAVDLTPKKDPFIAIHKWYSEADQVLFKCRQYLTKKSSDAICELAFVDDSMSYQVRPLARADKLKWRELKSGLVRLVRGSGGKDQ